MPFLCIFPYNPFSRRSRRAYKLKKQQHKQNPTANPTPKMVQLPRKPPAPVSDSHPTQSYTSPPGRVPRPMVPQPQALSRRIAEQRPLKCKALNPNQTRTMPAQAPPPPKPTPTTSQRPLDTCMVYGNYRKQERLSETRWLPHDKLISSFSGIGSPVCAVPPAVKSSRLKTSSSTTNSRVPANFSPLAPQAGVRPWRSA